MGASPPVRIPSYLWVLAAIIRGSEPSPKYKRFLDLAAIPLKKILGKNLEKLDLPLHYKNLIFMYE
jgi:hypothetical protein